MTRPKGFVYGVTLAVGLTLGCAGLSPTQSDQTGRRLVLNPANFVTEDALGVKSRMFRTGSVASGPRIELKSPTESVFPQGNPVAVHIEFHPGKDGIDPNMETLIVLAQKKTFFGWLGQDITHKVKPFIKGRAIRVQEMDFSGYTGDFRFKIRINDVKDRQSEESFNVTIQEV